MEPERAKVGSGADRLAALDEAGPWLRAAERAWAPMRPPRFGPIKQLHEAEMREVLDMMVRALRFHCPRRAAEYRRFTGRKAASYDGLVGTLIIAPRYFESVSREFAPDATLDVPAIVARADALVRADRRLPGEVTALKHGPHDERDRAFAIAVRLVRELRRAGRYVFAHRPEVAAEFVDLPNANRQKRSREQARRAASEPPPAAPPADGSGEGGAEG